MFLVAPLASGIIGGANGTAFFYQRGTGTAAQYYTTFEADQSYSGGGGVALDGYGSAEVYVNEVVDVVVQDSGGNTIREFTAGDSAPGVEVISNSFTGTGYATGRTAAGQPTNLQTVLDRWLMSAGTTDFYVMVGGVRTLLQNAWSSAQWYNVTDARFGAVGDASTDDTAAIQAAIDAAQGAGGGWIYFPKTTGGGVYRITGALTMTDAVSLVGSTSAGSCIAMDHATANSLSVGGGGSGFTQYVINLRFKHLQNNTGDIFRLSSNFITFESCVFGEGDSSQGLAINDAANTAHVHVNNCEFYMRSKAIDCAWVWVDACQFSAQGNQNAAVVKSTTKGWVTNSIFWTSSQSGCSPVLVDLTNFGHVANCYFDLSGAACSITAVSQGAPSGSMEVVGCNFASPGAGSTIVCVDAGNQSVATVTGCRFGAKGSATAVTGIKLGGTETSIAESGNIWAPSSGANPVDITPYSYTLDATKQAFRFLESRKYWVLSTSQSGGGTFTAATNLWETIIISVNDNTNFNLAMSQAPKGCKATLIVVENGGAGTGTITWSTNVYGTPDASATFTVAAGKIRTYTFRSVIYGGAYVWMEEGNGSLAL